MKKFISVLLAVALVAIACCVFVSAEDTNLALGKSYTIKGLFPTADAPTYPDEEGKSLTDGKGAEQVAFGDAAWVGLNTGAPDMGEGAKSNITVDLGAVSQVTKFVVEVYDGKGDAGISAPSAVEFFYSADGENWTSAGTGALDIESEEACINTVSLTLSAAVEAKYVMAEFTHGSNWAFVSEFEAYGTTGSGSGDASEDEPTSSTAPVESSSTTSSTPSTSDAGIVAVVVLAIVAVTGAAIVVKKRA